MGRPKKEGVVRRVQIRVNPQWAGVFDSYSSDQISELVGKAIANFSPRDDTGDRVITVIRPENPASKTIARLSVNDSVVRALFPEMSEEFREVIKLKCGFTWDAPYWVKRVEKNIEYEVSLAAYNLLSSGFCVQSEEVGIAEKVISGEFQETGLRKVSICSQSPFDGWLKITWPRSGENYYDEAIAITAAKYKSGAIIIPPEHYEEVEDFAEQYDFSFSPDAMQAVDKAKISESVGFVPSKKRQQRIFSEVEQGIPSGLVDED